MDSLYSMYVLDELVCVCVCWVRPTEHCLPKRERNKSVSWSVSSTSLDPAAIDKHPQQC